MANTSVNEIDDTKADLLIERAKAGSSETLGRLLQMFNNYLTTLASLHLDEKIRGRVSPSDIVQETLMDAHRGFEDFRGKCERELQAWLRQILVNNLREAIERHVLTAKRNVNLEFSLEKAHKRLGQSSVHLQELVANDQPSPSFLIEQAEHQRFLADRLATLPDDYREVVLLRNIEGLSFKEVATRMNRSHGAVRMLWLRAIEALRQEFAKSGLL